MARAKVFGNHILLLLLAVSCASLPDKNSIYLNDTNRLQLPLWVSVKPPAWIDKNTRHITASGPAVLQDILNTTGCMDGTAAVSLENHTLFADRDVWEVICGSFKREKIVMIFPERREEKYSYYKTVIGKRLEQAEAIHKPAPEKSALIYLEVLENEPSLPLPRLRLALFYLNKKECSTAGYHAGIFSAVNPGFAGLTRLGKKLAECSG